MRKRLREDRDIVMSGNIGGIYQKYGEDKRVLHAWSAWTTRPSRSARSRSSSTARTPRTSRATSTAVSVLFRKQRFSGAPMTGEVKFFDQQFAQSGNRLSFKYGRLNEASTEWLDYEYKPKWSFYGGVEWEGRLDQDLRFGPDPDASGPAPDARDLGRRGQHPQERRQGPGPAGQAPDLRQGHPQGSRHQLRQGRPPAGRLYLHARGGEPRLQLQGRLALPRRAGGPHGLDGQGEPVHLRRLCEEIAAKGGCERT
ncbi:MAG: hypothetical protein MZV70_01260 [Desulfobacterales bacterium]|nr:hypothetical protein [Desulfobacterales bacterium]